jgi:hypothetical protein
MSNTEYFSHFITDERGKLIEVPQRRGVQDGVFIDWLSITFHQDTLLRYSGCPLVSDAEYMYTPEPQTGRNTGVRHYPKMQVKG